MFKTILVLCLLGASNAHAAACDVQKALAAVKSELNVTAKTFNIKSFVVSSPTTIGKDPDFQTFLFKFESDSAVGGPLGMIGFDMKKCEVTGTLILPIFEKANVE